VLNFQQNLCARIETRNAVLSPSAATESAPFEGELRATFGATLADMPVRALHFARGASSAPLTV